MRQHGDEPIHSERDRDPGSTAEESHSVLLHT